MAEVKPFAASQLFTDLVGRNVGVSQVTAAPKATAKQMYGEYIVKPMETTSVVQFDLPLLGSLGGAMLGLPAESIKERLSGATIEEGLRDAMHEVLNVSSTIVSNEFRAVFQKMHTETSLLSPGALDTLRSPLFRTYFVLSVAGYEGGAMSILAP